MPPIPGLTVDDRQHSHVLQRPLAAPRRGIMLHYDDSSRDDWAVERFHDPRCTNGYTWLVLDDGRVIELALMRFHAWHADSVDTRIVDHDAQAIWTPAYTSRRELWGTLGRKVDPTGQRADKRPIIDVASVRRHIKHSLGGPEWSD